jgi:hypothetical protein
MFRNFPSENSEDKGVQLPERHREGRLCGGLLALRIPDSLCSVRWGSPLRISLHTRVNSFFEVSCQNFARSNSARRISSISACDRINPIAPYTYISRPARMHRTAANQRSFSNPTLKTRPVEAVPRRAESSHPKGEFERSHPVKGNSRPAAPLKAGRAGASAYPISGQANAPVTPLFHCSSRAAGPSGTRRKP